MSETPNTTPADSVLIAATDPVQTQGMFFTIAELREAMFPVGYMTPADQINAAAAGAAQSAANAAIPIARLGQPLGPIQADGSNKVPIANLPSSVLGTSHYLGVWNASTNTPVIVSGTAPDVTSPVGGYYIVSVSGTPTIDGVSVWTAGDWIIWNGSTWDNISGQVNPVSSVAGIQGAVTTSQLAAALAGAAGLSSTGGQLNVKFGTAANTAAAGNDARITGALQGSNNLSDLDSATSAQINLGLTSVASSAFNSAGGPPKLDGNANFSGQIFGPNTSAFTNLAQLQSYPTTNLVNGQVATVLGYANIFDNGGGPPRYWNSNSTAIADGVMVTLPAGHTGPGRWIARFTGLSDPRWFGAVADWNDGAHSGTDNSAAFARWMAYLVSSQTMGFIPNGYFGFSQPQAPAGIFPGMVGQGPGYSRFYFSGSAGSTAFTFNMAGNISGNLKNFSLVSAGAQAGTGVQRNAIRLIGGGNLNIEQLAAYNFNGYALAATQLWDSVITDLLAETCGNNSQYKWYDSVISLSNPTQLSSQTAFFSPSIIGQQISVTGAGAGGATLSAIVTGYQSATQITLSTPASTAVSGASGQAAFAYGHAFSLSPAGDTCNHLLFNRMQIEASIDQAMYIDPSTLNCVFTGIHSERTSRLNSSAGAFTHQLQGVSCTFTNARIEGTSGLENVLVGSPGGSYSDFKMETGATLTVAYGTRAHCTFNDFHCTGPVVVPSSNLLRGTLIGCDMSYAVGASLNLISQLQVDESWEAFNCTIENLGLTNSACTLICYGCNVSNLITASGNPVFVFDNCVIEDITLGALGTIQASNTQFTGSVTTSGGLIMQLRGGSVAGLFTLASSGGYTSLDADGVTFQGGMALGGGTTYWRFGPNNVFQGAVSAGFGSAPLPPQASGSNWNGLVTYNPAPTSAGIPAWSLVAGAWVAWPRL